MVAPAFGLAPPEGARLSEQHLGLVYLVARRMARRCPRMPLEDVIGYGCVGLVEAEQRFDASLGLAFSTFAAPRIRGAILDAARSRAEDPGWSRATRRRVARYTSLDRILEAEGGGGGRWSVETSAERAAEVALLWGRIEAMGPQTATVMRGIYGDAPLTQAELGRRLQLTESRVSQIHNAALRQLRNPRTDGVMR